MYATQSTMIYWVEISPGRFVKRIKETTKKAFRDELNYLSSHICRANKKAAKK